jgi:hypothetical protein
VTFYLDEFQIEGGAGTSRNIRFTPNGQAFDAFRSASAVADEMIAIQTFDNASEQSNAISQKTIEILEMAGIRSRTKLNSCSGDVWIQAPAIFETRIVVENSAAASLLRPKLQFYASKFCN